MPEKTKSPRITKGRAKRALQVGSLTTSVGSSYVWHALKRPFQSPATKDQELFDLHLKNAMRIVESSRELRGAFMKLVQMLSMRDDIFPTEALNILSVVQSSVPPMEYSLIREQIKTELGKYPEQLFKTFDHDAFAAASLGQVHKATLKNGKTVVVKVQYPGVDETVEQDLKNLKALLQVFTTMTRDVLRQKFDASEIYQEMEERLREELDYVNEANNLALFQRLFADDTEVIIPRVYPDFSARRVLTMAHVEGYKLQDMFSAGVDQSLKDWLSVKYFQITWRQIIEFGVLHTDPHPGNYLVTYHPKIAMLDFGSVRIFPEEIRKGYLALASAILDRDERTMEACFITLGYLNAGEDPKPLVKIMHLIFEPVLEDRVYDPHEFDSVSKTVEITNIGIENRVFNAPGHRLFLVRALWGLDSYIHQWRTITNWHRVFRECVARVKR
ncbi:MAG: AarF/ABC1/UbiB kinase family protein [Deltaproteobacteria bacterium]|nr:AarF/ABC1/UbiB kinase family protein [Deltaproteobacteria bacterium]